MSNLPLLTGTVGVVASGMLILFSYLLPRWFISVAVQDVDAVRLGKKVLSKKESKMLGVFLHMLFSFFFGAVYGVGMNAGVFALDALSMGIFVILITIAYGGIVLPLEGHGLFGWKEDHWIPVDLLAMNIVWILIFWVTLAVLV